jgi:lysozyme family protein
MNTKIVSRIRFALCLTAALVPSLAAAKDMPVTPRNQQYDVNKDGKLDEQERVAMKADRAAKRQARILAKYDANKNGILDPEEEAKYKADLAAKREQRAQQRKAREAEKAAAAAMHEDADADDDDAALPSPSPKP